MTVWSDVCDDPRSVKVLDHGFVRLVDVMGSDKALCEAARTSYGEGTKTVNDDRGLIRYLFRKRHTSPIEMAEVKFHIKMPIFVMRQHVRHRTASLNEHSGRYSIMPDEFYIPDEDQFLTQSETNKQGSSDSVVWNAESLKQDMLKTYATANTNYKHALTSGLSRELARIQLPVSNYTELYWKIDLKNFLDYVRLREDVVHAQYPIRCYANAMFNLIQPLFPIACEAFEDYWSTKNTYSLSRMELKLIKDIINERFLYVSDVSAIMKEYGMSKREVNEFLERFFLGE